MKIGVNFKINLSKIDKSKLFNGANGAVYLDATSFIDLENVGKYGDHGIINQAKKKDDTEKGAILGNAKIFWRDDNQQAPKKQAPQFDNKNFDDDIPF